MSSRARPAQRRRRVDLLAGGRRPASRGESISPFSKARGHKAGHALGHGLRPFVLLRLLRLAAEVNAEPDTKKAQLFAKIATQFEQWLTGYSRVRLYTGVTLLETVDVAVMREVVATTSLEESIVQNIHPTLCIVKPHTIGHIVEELKQRGQSPLLHDEDL